jgi:tripartite-type tricarboxylate transporter receptor subunit TctC
MSSFTRRSLLCVTIGAAAVPHVAAAQPAFPSRPIRVIMPHTAGSYDVYARLIAPRLHQVLGQPFVVDHRPGANGNIALAEIGRAAPDGHTLLFGPTGTLTANVSLYRNMPLDPVDDLAPIVLATTTPMVWLTQPNSEIDGLPTLLRIAKARPGLLNYSFPGIGTLNHLVAEAFKQLHQIEIQGVPASGPAASMVEAIAGRVHVAVESLGSCWDHVSTGRLRALAVTTRQRIPQLPQVPTAVELGLENREYLGWYAFLAPRNTPAAIIRKLNEAINEALRQPEVEARVRGLGASVAGGTPEELRAFLLAERDTWREVIRGAGIELS